MNLKAQLSLYETTLKIRLNLDFYLDVMNITIHEFFSEKSIKLNLYCLSFEGRGGTGADPS